MGEEMVARVTGLGHWVDPNNGGNYTVLEKTPYKLHTRRTSNPEKVKLREYEQLFNLVPAGDICEINACSKSTGDFLHDDSINFCNLYNLFCGRRDGCATIRHTFWSKVTGTVTSAGVKANHK